MTAGQGRRQIAETAPTRESDDRARVGLWFDRTATDSVSTARDGDTVTVTTSRYDDGKQPADATFSLTRTDNASERVITEQLMASGQFAMSGGGLRNALPFCTDEVSRVVVDTDERAVDGVLGYDTSRQRFRFRGQAYEVTRGRSAD